MLEFLIMLKPVKCLGMNWTKEVKGLYTDRTVIKKLKMQIIGKLPSVPDPQLTESLDLPLARYRGANCIHLKKNPGIPVCLCRLRVWCCHCSGSGGCCGMGLILGQEFPRAMSLTKNIHISIDPHSPNLYGSRGDGILKENEMVSQRDIWISMFTAALFKIVKAH